MDNCFDSRRFIIILIFIFIVSLGANYLSAQWKDPVKINGNINTGNNESYPFISANGKKLYFVSDKPGGHGQTDIYVSNWTNTGWGPSINLGSLINTKASEQSPSLTKDGKLLYFVRWNYRYGWDIYRSANLGGDTLWSPPKRMGPHIDTPGFETGVSVSSDGKSLYFSSTRPGGYGMEDIWMCEWGDSGWVRPENENLGRGINTDLNEGCVTMAADEKEMYFDRWDIFPENPSSKGIFVSHWDRKRWGTAEKVKYPVNSDSTDLYPYITPDGKYLYFGSDRSGGYGKFDIWYVRRDSLGKWTDLKNMGPVINTADDEGDPFLSPDGKKLYFARSEKLYGSCGDGDIFVSNLSDTGWIIPKKIIAHARSPYISPEGDKLYYIKLWRSSYGHSYPVGYTLDIAYSTWQDTGWGKPKRVNSNNINSPEYDEYNIFFSYGGDRVYVSSWAWSEYGQADIVYFEWQNGGVDWGPAKNLGLGVNSLVSKSEESPCISVDGKHLFFGAWGSDYAGNYGENDIFECTWDGTNWSAAKNLGKGVNSKSWDWCPSISSDGKTLYFASRRSNDPQVNDINIWMSRLNTDVVKEKQTNILPKEFKLFQNYPNPFNPTTTIRYQLPKAAHVIVGIYDLQGRLVETLVNGEREPGSYLVTLHAENQPSGMYFYRIQAGQFSATKKLLLLK